MNNYGQGKRPIVGTGDFDQLELCVGHDEGSEWINFSGESLWMSESESYTTRLSPDRQRMWTHKCPKTSTTRHQTGRRRRTCSP
jgi:hypothetical protein